MPVFHRRHLWSSLSSGFSRLSIVVKVALAYYAVVLLPIAAIVLIGSARLERQERSEAIDRYERALLQTRQRIREALVVAEQTTDLLVLNYEVVDLLSKEFVLQDIVPFRDRVIRLIRNIVALTPGNINAMTLYVDNATVPESWYTVMRMDKFQHDRALVATLERSRTGIWLHPELGHKRFGELAFVYLRPLFRLDGTFLGVVQCELPATRIISETLGLVNPDDVLLLVDNAGNISSSARGIAVSGAEGLAQLSGISGVHESSGRIFVYDTVNHLNVRLAIGLSRARLHERLRSRSVVTFVVFLLSTVFVGFLSLFISRRILGRFRMIVAVMSRVAHGHLDERIPSSGEDEIAEITEDFNLLIARIKRLIEETAERERRQNEARFMALQYRINPHMIYNTLDLFGMRLELTGDYEGAEAMSDFGKLLRYHTAGNYRTATVEEEIAQVENYISVERIRHTDRVSLFVDLPEELRTETMMRFVLQPIVENALHHGMPPEAHLRIEVRVRRSGPDLRIIVEDDGVGMGADSLAAVRRSLSFDCAGEPALPGANGIGLRNINERCILAHGPEFALQIESELGNGTRVIYRAPASRRNDAAV